MKLKKFSESEQIASRQTNPITLSASEQLTKSEVVALRRKKELINEELQNRVEGHLAKLIK